jgi:cytochrome c biogenesis protein CcmG/thiol:disulfide interchange protein DsbE
MRYLWILIGAAGLVSAFALAYLHQSRAVAAQFSSGAHPIAPQFSVATIDGQTLDLASYRGKVVLLDFWATWCSPCREEIPRFVQLQDKYRKSGFQVIGISMDDGPEPVRQFYRDFRMNYPVALGGAKLGELYGGVLGLPIAFLIGRDGHIYAKHVGATLPSTFDAEIATLLASKAN